MKIYNYVDAYKLSDGGFYFPLNYQITEDFDQELSNKIELFPRNFPKETLGVY